MADISKKLQTDLLEELLLRKMLKLGIINRETYEKVQKEKGVCRDGEQ
ncbi:hypothetical protein H6A65_01720 [Mediterraneibacter glycyrrhizinilyticus]|nr:hypothetical protein [Mediterraneibacter glycyrrhizinilyticus]MBM6750224.1 hypothetical protein [Mediterraneibacter glycyrrhizinilyticus]